MVLTYIKLFFIVLFIFNNTIDYGGNQKLSQGNITNYNKYYYNYNNLKKYEYKN